MKQLQIMRSALASKKARSAAAAGAIVLATAAPALAGTDTTFDGISTQMTSWITGSLGVVIALGGLVYGVMALFKQNYAGLAIGVVAALAGSTGPAIISGIFTGVI